MKLEKWPFLDLNLALTLLGKKGNFSTFWTSCFYRLERTFFFLEYPKRHIADLYCLKKRSWKNGNFWTKTFGWPFWKKRQFFDFLKFFFFIAEKGVFSFQNIVKDIFLPYFADKKEVGKMTIFRRKPWVNPFGKMAIFRLFELLVFIA